MTTAVGAARLAAMAAFSSGVRMQPASAMAAVAPISAMRVTFAIVRMPLFVMPEVPDP
jgi:hypothetical protein